MLKKAKKQTGFTLVEVIVVAVIVAVLAAVAIPLYLNYIEDSRSNAASNAAGSIASFCGACVAVGGTPSINGTQAECDANTAVAEIPEKITVTINAGTVTAQHEDGGEEASFSYPTEAAAGE